MSDTITIILSFIYANETNRVNAVGLVAGDIGKFAKQFDNSTYWELLNNSPVTWGALSSSTVDATDVTISDVIVGDHTELSQTVVRIQNIPVSAAIPVDGYALVYDGVANQWKPQFVSTSGGSGVGPQGPQGSPGAAGGSAVNIQNAGVSLGLFPTINLVGALNGTTGPNNTVNINSLPDFLQVGITGVGATAPSAVQLASSAMIQWNTEKTKIGALGHTTIGTAAGFLTVNKSAYYQVNRNINFTGLPSGVVIQAQEFLGATGGNGRLGFGSGTPIDVSMSYLTVASPSGIGSIEMCDSIDKSYVVYIPSGTSIETYVNYIRAGGGSAVYLSPTGTYFDIRSIGT